MTKASGRDVLHVIRHGETDWNREPARCQGWAEVALNETGRAQARAAGARLRTADPPVELIVTSHLTRAQETAAIVREQLARDDGASPAAGEALVDLVVDERLAETRRGGWETRLFSDIIANEPEAWHSYREHPESFRFPGGESLVEQLRRVLEAVRDATRCGRVALLVTHGGSIRVLRCFLEERGLETFHDGPVSAPGSDVLTIDTERLAVRIDAFLGLGHDPGGGTRGACDPHG